MSSAAEQCSADPRRSAAAEALNSLNRQRRAIFDSTTLETRRAFVALLHKGVDFVDAAKATGLSFDQALEVRRVNTRTKKTVRTWLVKPEDVK